jgi:hypothetical protein
MASIIIAQLHSFVIARVKDFSKVVQGWQELIDKWEESI